MARVLIRFATFQRGLFLCMLVECCDIQVITGTLWYGFLARIIDIIAEFHEKHISVSDKYSCYTGYDGFSNMLSLLQDHITFHIK